VFENGILDIYLLIGNHRMVLCVYFYFDIIEYSGNVCMATRVALHIIWFSWMNIVDPNSPGETLIYR
jgi:hypothetical protein